MENKGIGVGVAILMCFIIAAVGICGFYFGILGKGGVGGGGLGGRGAPPNAMLLVSAIRLGDNITLAISHEQGDDVNLADITVMASDNTGTMVPATLSSSTGKLSVGGSITATYTYGTGASDVITVYIIHNPSKNKIFINSRILVQ